MARNVSPLQWARQLLPVLLLGAMDLTQSAYADEASLTCFSTAFEPFVIEQSNGEISGIDVDVIREVALRTGLNIQIGLKPWLRLEQDFRDGKTGVSCGFSYSLTEAREHYLHYTSVPLHTTEYVVFYRSADIPGYQGLQSLSGKTVAVNRGFRRPEAFDQALKEGLFKVFEVTQDSQGFEMLVRRRVDAVLANSDVGKYLLFRMQPGEAISASPALTSMPTFLVFARGTSAAGYAARFDQALSEIILDGTYQRIFQRYTGEPPAQ